MRVCLFTRGISLKKMLQSIVHTSLADWPCVIVYNSHVLRFEHNNTSATSNLLKGFSLCYLQISCFFQISKFSLSTKLGHFHFRLSYRVVRASLHCFRLRHICFHFMSGYMGQSWPSRGMERIPFSHAMLSVNPNAGYFLFSKLSIFCDRFTILPQLSDYSTL